MINHQGSKSISSQEKADCLPEFSKDERKKLSHIELRVEMPNEPIVEAELRKSHKELRERFLGTDRIHPGIMKPLTDILTKPFNRNCMDRGFLQSG